MNKNEEGNSHLKSASTGIYNCSCPRFFFPAILKSDLKENLFEALKSSQINSKVPFDSVAEDIWVRSFLSQFFQNYQARGGCSELPVSQRKQYFSEYQAQAAKRERLEQRSNESKAREVFRALLESWVEKDQLDPDLTFRQLASVAKNTDWWSALRLEEVDEIFQEFISANDSKVTNKMREKRHQMMRDLFKLLQDRWGGVPTFPSWRDASLYISQNQDRFPLLDDLDKFNVFEDYIREKLEKRREDRRRHERREGRKKRDNFSDLLKSMKPVSSENLEALKWEHVHKQVFQTAQYMDLIGTRNSSQPYDLFCEVRSAWKRDAEATIRSASVDSDTKRLKS